MPITEGSFFFENSLREILQQIARPINPLLWGNGMYLPNLADLSPGTKTLSIEVLKRAGLADVITGSSTEVPVVAIESGELKFPVAMLASAFIYTQEDMDAARLAQANGQRTADVSREKVEACNLSIDTKAHYLALFGSPESDLKGLLNYPETPEIDSALDPYDAGTTPEELLDFFVQAYNTAPTRTYLVAQPNMALCSLQLYTRLGTLSFGNGAGGFSVLDKIRGLFPELIIRPVPECHSDFLTAQNVEGVPAGKSLLFFYNLSDQGFRRKTTPVFSMPTEVRDLNYRVILYKYVSSVFNPYPEASVRVYHTSQPVS